MFYSLLFLGMKEISSYHIHHSSCCMLLKRFLYFLNKIKINKKDLLVKIKINFSYCMLMQNCQCLAYKLDNWAMLKKDYWLNTTSHCSLFVYIKARSWPKIQHSREFFRKLWIYRRQQQMFHSWMWLLELFETS